VDYDRGVVVAGAEGVVDTATPVRAGLEAAARAAGLEDADLPDYLGAVRALVSEMSAHGHGGILIIHPDEAPDVAAAPYRMVLDSSPASLLRLARRIAHADGSPPSSRPRRYFQHGGGDEPPVSFRSVL